MGNPTRAILIFLLVLTYFVLGNGWYVPATLRIVGIATEKRADVDVSWDSGGGWNRYERRIFPVATKSDPETPGHHRIRIAAIGEKHPASLSTEVVCAWIRIDGQALDFNSLSHTGQQTEAGIRLSQSGQEIRLSAPAQEHIAIGLLTNNHSGKASVSVNDQVTTRDLYMANIEAKSTTLDYWVVSPEGRFVLTLPMPRYRVHTLQISNRAPSLPVVLSSVDVLSEKGTVPLRLDPTEPLTRLRFADVSGNLKQHVAPSRLAAQVVYAGLATWLIVTLLATARNLGGFKSLLLERRRWVFWAFFLFSALVYALWLAAFWPGVMSVDSLKVWRAAQLPEVMINDHPMLVVLLYGFLQHIWNHVAVVPVFHIVCTSLLVAHICFHAYRYGVSLWAILPVYLATVFSVSIGVYNIVLWKDIPFAILVVFWSFTLADLYRKRRTGELNLSRPHILALLLSYLALGLIRHNGIVYLAVIPVMLVVLRIVPVKTAAIAAGFLIIAGLSATALLRSRFPVADAGFLVEKSAQYILPQLQKHPITKTLTRTAGDYWGILDITQTRSKWDLWHYYLEDRRAYRFLRHAGWSDAFPYLGENSAPLTWLGKVGMQIYRKSYETPWVFAGWNPVPLLAVFPVTVLLCCWLPLSSIFSGMILIQTLTLLGLVNILNWRYYYFVYLGALFLPLVILWDLKIYFQKHRPPHSIAPEDLLAHPPHGSRVHGGK